MDVSFLILAGAVVLAAVIVAVAVRRKPAPPPPVDAAVLLEPRLAQLSAAQSEISGRFQQTIAAQTQLQTVLAGQIEALNKRLDETLTASATKTAETMGNIQTRLSV
ncbi:MAG TPA: hypothetical protein VK779_08920, partial [Rhizomicrobium sp.]|nr:hypothetical protein [Rhizomicrobium sp.]